MLNCFISDLHLQEGSDSDALFLKFIKEVSPKLNKLFILGDLFEYWVGDDVATPYQLNIMNKLASLNDSGIETFFIPGNRDFLIGNSFLQRSKMKLLKEPFPITINNKRYLLVHGDTLCTLDKNYQMFRKVAQATITKKIFLSLPGKVRHLIAQKLRNKPKYKMPTHNPIFDAEDKTVIEQAKIYNCKYIIHGHTHKPNIHKHNDITRVVLGDWHQETKILFIGDTNKLDLSSFSMSN